MGNSQGKIKWRLNLFDVIIICAAAAAVLIVYMLTRSGGGSIAAPGASEKVVYTIELTEMMGESASRIKAGDALVDKIEKRPMGSVVSVEVGPATRLQKNSLTGGFDVSEIPGKHNAVIVITAEATVTDSQISIGGFIVRAGAKVSVNGPLYHGDGYIIDIEREAA